MPAPTVFEVFADELLASVPALAVQSCDRAHGQLKGASLAHAAAGDRQHTMTVLEATLPGGRGLAAALSAALREQLREELARPVGPVVLPDDAPAEPSLDSLTLVDDAQIEQDIEVARVIQLVDTAAEADLRDLRALCATMRGVDDASPELHPMRPEVCARALVRALQQTGWPREPRMLALRTVGRCMADQLAALYRLQLATLRQRGVKPVAYRLRIAPEAAATPRAGDGAMQNLAGRIAPAADQAAAQLIPRLLAQVADQAGLDEPLRQLLSRLANPAMRSTRDGAGVLSSFEHPVWRLVDRVATLASVQSGIGVGSARLAARLEPVVSRLERMSAVSAVAFEQALADVEDVASQWADARLTDAGVLAGAEVPDATGSLPTDWGGGSLPTVPMSLSPDEAGAQAGAWWAGLREGQLLRIFLHARWATLLVIGCTRTHLLLARRDGKAQHTLTRRAALQLREQGLATTIDTPNPVRMAVDTLTLDLDGSD